MYIIWYTQFPLGPEENKLVSIGYCLLSIAFFLLSIVYCDCLLPMVYCIVSITDCLSAELSDYTFHPFEPGFFYPFLH